MHHSSAIPASYVVVAVGASGGAGEGKFVEADETYVGGKAKNRAYTKTAPAKEAVMSLVERGGKVRSHHLPDVTATTLRPILVDAIAKDTHFRTDSSPVYTGIGEGFKSHATVNHSIREYVRGDAHTNTAEGYFRELYALRLDIQALSHYVISIDQGDRQMASPHRDTPEYLNGFRAAFNGSQQGDCPHEHGTLAWKQWTSGWFNYHPSYGDRLIVRQRRDGWTVTRVASGQEYGAWNTAEDAVHAFRENASLGLVAVER